MINSLSGADLYSILGSSSLSSSIGSLDSSSSSSSIDFSSLLSSVLDTSAISYADTKPAPPDFDSMSIDEFSAHIQEVQAKMLEDGVESNLPDISEMSDDELLALKDDMASRRAGHIPPPQSGMEDLISAFSSTTETEDLASMLMQAIEEMQEYQSETEDNTFSNYLSSSLSYEQLVAQYSNTTGIFS